MRGRKYFEGNRRGSKSGGDKEDYVGREDRRDMV